MTSLRIRSLASMDPSSVPLPNGTEVTSSVDRTTVDGARVVAQGAVGRVVSSDASGVLVKVVGVGDVRYLREELTPRRFGQVRYAIAREASERALQGASILEATVGSRAWNLSDKHSDTDLRGVFLWPFPWTTGLSTGADTLISADGSAVQWELGKALHQLLRADPNTLEMLWVPDIRVHDALGEKLLAMRDAFVSEEVYGTFGRYALSQARKLSQNARLAEHRALVLGWLKASPSLTLDATAAKLAAETELSLKESEAVARCKQYLKQLCRSMHDQGLLPSADFAALKHFAEHEAMDFDLPRELRPKNAYNLLRLLGCAIQWMKTGAPLIGVEGDFRARLLSIKKGEVPLSQCLAWAEAMGEELETARAVSVLPKRPDLAAADAFLREARAEAARRWFAGVGGVFGPDGPLPPSPGFEQDENAALEAAMTEGA